MIYNMKKAITVISMVIFGGYIVSSCEPEPDSLGEQLFLDDAANGKEISFDLIAYNINNNDTIQSDASRLQLAALGVFDEAQFGKQKASYFTQIRLNSYDPDFGANAVVDSVVLVVKPSYASDSLTTTTNENYIFPKDSVAAKKVVNTYPALKFGKAKYNEGKMKINVHEVSDFLNGYNDKVYSNKDFAISTLLGSKEFSGYVTSVAITKDSDNSTLFSSEAGIRIPLDPTFFQTKIIDKKGKPELKDVSNFIRYFRGLKISVDEVNGYLMQFSPNNLELVMYYKNDKVDAGVTTRPQSTFKFSVGDGNAHISNFKYTRAGSALSSAPAPNKETGDLKLFAQGMGGNSIGIKFKPSEIDKLKKLYQENKAAIISAKIRMYTDPTAWDNKYTKPSILTIVQNDIVDGEPKVAFTEDMVKLTSPIGLSYMKAYDLDKTPAYYEFIVTQSLKDIVEGGSAYGDKFFTVDLAQFARTSDGNTLVGAQYTSRAYSTNRVVFVGSDPNNAIDDTVITPKEIKLRVTYSTK